MPTSAAISTGMSRRLESGQAWQVLPCGPHDASADTIQRERFVETHDGEVAGLARGAASPFRVEPAGDAVRAAARKGAGNADAHSEVGHGAAGAGAGEI
eukprot:COSAG04_NODE_7746_length_1073_cov_2.365188_3_plen_98_part_01